MKKNIVKFHSYKNKLNWQSFLNGLKLGYSNKIKFIKLYKMEKYIKKYGNDKGIALIIILLRIIVCLYIWFA